ncbi:MAG TPA: hypothetical protein VKB80_15260 [Kofleriaceae bacterium]|nr:hypothetical protein [Kofleriaceae bacterium]
MIVVEGSAPDLIFRHADGRPYGQQPPRCDAATEGGTAAEVVAGMRRDDGPAADPRPAPAAAGVVAGLRRVDAPASDPRPAAAAAEVVAGLRRVDAPASDPRPAAAEVAAVGDVADVLAGLRRMGVPAPDARRAAAEAAASGAVAIEDLLRHALLVLRRTTYAHVARVA